MDSQPDQEQQTLYSERAHMLETLQRRGFTNPRVLHAMGSVPREEFVATNVRHLAYDDNALPIECGQTISQPTVVAMMTSALAVTPSSKVLEIGTGSGYQAAVLSLLAESVVTVERHPDLAAHASAVLKRLGLNNVEVHAGDGSLGWPETAPYDRILITAATPSAPLVLLEQLRRTEGSRLVAPIGNQERQRMVVIERSGDEWIETTIGEVRFVPLRGQAGWSLAEWRDPRSTGKDKQ